MSETVHEVREQGGVSFHGERRLKRSHEDFNLKDMSDETAKSFCRVCGKPVDSDGTIEEPTAADYRHVFESSIGAKLMAEIYVMGAK